MILRNQKILILISGILASAVGHAGAPSWTTGNTQKMTGNIFTVICVGEGPSLDVARTDALNSCRASATEQLSSHLKVNSLVVGTESDTAFHQEVARTSDVQGLICQPQKEFFEEKDGFFKLWLQCKFDLKAVVINSAPTDNTSSNQGVYIKSQGNISSAERRLSIATVPQCSSLIVKGKRPRSVKCVNNPVTVLINDNDEEILLRADGFKPKTVDLKKGGVANATIQVIFE